MEEEQDKAEIKEEELIKGSEKEVNGNGESDKVEKGVINLKDLSEDRTINTEISGEMKRAYIDYAMSVIVSRALPSVEDGLKPVHRRILYAMKSMGLEKGTTKKCARIVGDTMGKFHPHGDMAIYDALVRLAQNFSLRYPLVKGQGNFGSIDGDSAAASRYTEAKLNKFSIELLQDIEKETVKLIPNFDNSLKEPVTLPGKLPNLIINGSSGIAVGMTTNIPPHNLSEVCDAISTLIDRPEMSTDEILEIIKGPDFPTGGQIVAENLKEIYESGRGSIVLRGKITSESGIKKDRIIITEIPYQVNKSELIKDIAGLARDKKLPDISDIRDESSKGKIRVVIELKKGSDSKFTINRLFKSTKMQSRFDVVLIALEEGVPKMFTLKKILLSYINYRRKIIRARTVFDLKKAEAREHIVKGLLIALANLDEVIKIIKSSKTTSEASESIQVKFGLSKKQTEAILETTLRQLTSLEHEKLKKEEEDLIKLIQELKDILDDEGKILKIIKKDLAELKKTYGDNRRTQVLQRIIEIKEKDLVKKEDVVITVTDKGYVKRMSFKNYREQKRGGKGVIGADLSTGDFVKQVLSCSTHDYLLLFTERGRVYWLKAHKVPESQRYGRGQAVVNLLSIKDDRISSIISVKKFENYLFMATKKGVVKKIKLETFSKPRLTGVRAINLPLDNSDGLIGVKVIEKDQEVMLMTMKGQAIRFNSSTVRSMGRASYGVRGIKLSKDDCVVSLESVLKGEGMKNQSILTITQKGYGKRSSVEDYRLTSRSGKGVINLKVTDKTGKVVKTISVIDKDEIIITTHKGIVIRTTVEDLRVMGRATQGVRIIKLNQDDEVSDIARLDKDENVD